MKCRNYIGITVMLLLSFFLFNFAYSMNNNLSFAAGQHKAAQIQQGVKLVYTGAVEDLPLEDLERVKAAYNALSSDSYYEIHTQFLVTNELCSDVFLYTYEEGHAADAQNKWEGSMEYALKAMELSSNCFEKFNIACDMGAAYTEDTYNGSEIPVVLGAAYKPYYALHDEIDATYIFKPIKLRVVGFLPQNTTLTLYNQPLILDRYMIIPSWNCGESASLHDERLFQLVHYVNKLEGYYEYEDAADLKAFQETVDEVSGTLPDRIDTVKLPAVEALPFLSFDQTLRIAKSCTVLSEILVIIGLPVLTVLMIRKHFHQICRKYLFGVPLLRIWLRECGMYTLSLFIAAALLVILNPVLSLISCMIYPITSFLLAAVSIAVFGILLGVAVSPAMVLTALGGKDDVKN